MKKILAIMLCVAMLFSVLAFSTVSAETNPTVKIITNEGSPVNGNFVTYFCVRFDDFSDIKGVDVKITAENAKITGVRTAGFPKAVDALDSEDENFDINKNGVEVHYVDFSHTEKARIYFEVTSPSATSKINVKGTYAQDGDTLFDVDSPATGTFEIKEAVKAPKDASDSLSQPANTTFIPYGAVYKMDGNEYVYAEKKADGTFDTADGDYKYSEFNLPSTKGDKIAAFGATTKIEHDWLLFGNYSEYDTTAKEHGTMIIEGDWLSLKEYYIKNGYTVQECLEKLSDDYDAKMATSDKHYVTYKVPDRDNLLQENLISSSATTKVNVYKFKRDRFMWRDNEGKLEYALRLHGIKPGETYTSIAYYVDGADKTHLSFHVKSVVEGSVGGNEGGDSTTPEEPANNIVYPAMQQGNLYKDANTGEFKVQTNNLERIYTAETYTIADYESITVASGYRANIVFFTPDGAYHHNQSWLPAGTHTLADYAGSASTLFQVVFACDPNQNPFTVDMYNAAGANGLALTKASK